MLTEIKNTILEQYQVRKNRKQKTAFINYVKSLCEEKGITCTVEKKGMSRNIVMGADPDSCKLVVGGHYDTCAVMPIPNFITPRNVFMFVLYQILLTLMLFLPCVILSAVVGYFTSPIIAGPIFSFSLLIMCGLMMFGPANRHTANDNTSGTVAVLNTMLTMTEEQRAGICFVLFDNEEIGLVGSSSFASMHKDVKKNIPVINLDCVSDGDNIFAKLPGKDKSSDFGTAFKAAVEASAAEYGMTPYVGTAGVYPSDQTSFKRGIGVAALNRSKLVGLYMNRIHTPRDTVFIDRNIDCLTDAIIRLTDGMAE